MDEDQFEPTLYWEPTYEIVVRLMETYPSANLNDMGLYQLLEMIVALPEFGDDPAIASEELLREILREWFEETDAR